jgi:hypothetical protein
MLIAVPAEPMAGETRVAVPPKTAKKLVGQGHSVDRRRPVGERDRCGVRGRWRDAHRHRVRVGGRGGAQGATAFGGRDRVAAARCGARRHAPSLRCERIATPGHGWRHGLCA